MLVGLWSHACVSLCTKCCAWVHVQCVYVCRGGRNFTSEWGSFTSIPAPSHSLSVAELPLPAREFGTTGPMVVSGALRVSASDQWARSEVLFWQLHLHAA